MKKMPVIMIVLLVGLFDSTNAEHVCWKKIGRIKPRHAKQIHSSNWSIGAETMDRDYTIFQNWKDYLGPLGVKKSFQTAKS